jgi:hypothetical protein
MLGSHAGRVKAQGPSVSERRRAVAGLCVLLLAICAGCYWRYYPQVMETHLALLSSYSDKLESFAEDRHAVPPEAWGEFTYPLERARDFSRIAARRFPGRASLERFDVALDRYQDLLGELGQLGAPGAAQAIAGKRYELDLAIAATRQALRQEAAAG